MQSKLFGLSCALSTPFSPAARVDTARLAEHAAWCLREGCDGVTIFGTTGEGAAAGIEERERAVRTLLAAGTAASRVVCGITACSLEEAVAQARVAMDARLAGLLLAPPFYVRDVSDDGLFSWFSAFFARLGGKAPKVYLYHIPSMTGVPLSFDLIGRLKTAFPDTVAGVKDSSGDWSNTEKLLATHGDLQILVGDERHIAGAMRQGGAGSICGLANLLPRLTRRTVHDGVEDPLVANAVNVLARYPFMAAVKTLIAYRRGDPGWRVMAPPLTPLSDADAQRLTTEFDAIAAAEAA